MSLRLQGQSPLLGRLHTLVCRKEFIGEGGARNRATTCGSAATGFEISTVRMLSICAYWNIPVSLRSHLQLFWQFKLFEALTSIWEADLILRSTVAGLRFQTHCCTCHQDDLSFLLDYYILYIGITPKKLFSITQQHVWSVMGVNFTCKVNEEESWCASGAPSSHQKQICVAQKPFSASFIYQISKTEV